LLAKVSLYTMGKVAKWKTGVKQFYLIPINRNLHVGKIREDARHGCQDRDIVKVIFTKGMGEEWFRNFMTCRVTGFNINTEGVNPSVYFVY